MNRRTRHILLSAIVGVVLVSIALYAQYPCFSIFFTDDALMLSFVVSGFNQRDQSLAPLVFTTWAGNFHPLWQLHFIIQLGILGMNAEWWHVSHAVYQASTAFLVFIWLRKVVGGWVAPLIASVLWAGMIIGGNDEPSLALFEGHYPVALFWLMLALVVGLRATDGRHLGWTLLSCFFTTLAFLTWGVALLGFLMCALQAFWFSDKKGWLKRSLSAPVLIPASLFLVMGACFFVVLKLSDPSVASSDERLSIYHVSYFINHFVYAFSNAFVFDPLADIPFADKFRVFLLVVASCCFLRRRHFFPIVLFSCIALPVVLAVVVKRPSVLYYASDYLYYPVLWFCIIVAMIADALIDRFRQYKPLLIVLICIGLMASLRFQHGKSENLYVRYSAHSDSIRASFEQNQRVLKDLASSSVGVVRIPNIPVVIDRNVPICFTAEALVGLMPRPLRSKFDVVSIPNVSRSEMSHVKSILQSMETSESQQWVDIIDTIAPDIQSLYETSEWLVQKQHVVVLPGFFMISYPEIGICMNWESIGFLLDRPLDGFSLDFRREVINDSDKSLLLSLDSTPINEGGKWQRLFDRAIKHEITAVNYLSGWSGILSQRLNGIELNSQQGSHGALLPFLGRADGVRVDRLHLADDRPWAVTLTQGVYHLERDKKYRIKFRARSEAERAIQVGFYSLDDSAPLDIPYQTCVLSEKWTDFEFLISISVDARSRLAFNLGGSEIPVEIEQIQVMDGQQVLSPDLSR